MPKIKEKFKHYNWNEKASYYLNLARATNKQPSYAELEENSASVDSSFSNMLSDNAAEANKDTSLIACTPQATTSSSNMSLNSLTPLKMEFRIKVLETHISELNEKLIDRDEKIMMQESQIEFLKREIEDLKTKTSNNNKNLDTYAKSRK